MRRPVDAARLPDHHRRRSRGARHRPGWWSRRTRGGGGRAADSATDLATDSARAAQLAQYEERLKPNRWLIDPNSKYMSNWDLVTLSALMFTAIVTPVEVAFITDTVVQTRSAYYTLYALNRCIDAIFIKDMCMQVVT